MGCIKNSMIKRFFILSLIVCFGFVSHVSANTVGVRSQIEPTKIQALNNYVGFINESIHGMVIVHRLLENYNQELNRYVDLEGYQINNFGNSDLPKNIFQDPDDWFYQISPFEWFTIAKDGSKVFPVAEATLLNKFMLDLRKKINEINQIRFDIDDYINQNDLSEKKNIETVYQLLERGTDLFDSFYEEQTKFEVLLIKLSRQYSKQDPIMDDVVDAFDKTWFSSKNILRSVRDKKIEVLPAQLNSLSAAIKQLKSIDIGTHAVTSFNTRKNMRAWEQAKTKLDNIYNNVKLLIETADVPKEYKLYGKFYYYHNAVLTNQINRYGSGFANEMNKIIRDINIPILLRIEEPHFYQVIYPKKLVAEDVIASSDDLILAVPTSLKNRDIKKSNRTIKVDTSVFEINLYDYKIQDGDIVSINFNGDWILENHSLEGSPTKLKVQMNLEGKNYLLLHAVNEGRNPPNTMAISYTYKGETEKIVLSSSLNESEMIEMLYEPK